MISMDKDRKKKETGETFRMVSSDPFYRPEPCSGLAAYGSPGFSVFARCRLPAIIKIACGAASEEASCIPLPPRRRKLHIRWLLLPFQTVTAALGHSLGIRGHFRVWRASLSFSSPGATILFFLKEEKEKNGGAKILQSFIHKRVWNVETGAVEKRLTDVSQRLLWTTL